MVKIYTVALTRRKLNKECDWGYLISISCLYECQGAQCQGAHTVKSLKKIYQDFINSEDLNFKTLELTYVNFSCFVYLVDTINQSVRTNMIITLMLTPFSVSILAVVLENYPGQ